MTDECPVEIYGVNDCGVQELSAEQSEKLAASETDEKHPTEKGIYEEELPSVDRLPIECSFIEREEAIDESPSIAKLIPSEVFHSENISALSHDVNNKVPGKILAEDYRCDFSKTDQKDIEDGKVVSKKDENNYVSSFDEVESQNLPQQNCTEDESQFKREFINDQLKKKYFDEAGHFDANDINCLSSLSNKTELTFYSERLGEEVTAKCETRVIQNESDDVCFANDSMIKLDSGENTGCITREKDLEVNSVGVDCERGDLKTNCSCETIREDHFPIGNLDSDGTNSSDQAEETSCNMGKKNPSLNSSKKKKNQASHVYSKDEFQEAYGGAGVSQSEEDVKKLQKNLKKLSLKNKASRKVSVPEERLSSGGLGGGMFMFQNPLASPRGTDGTDAGPGTDAEPAPEHGTQNNNLPDVVEKPYKPPRLLPQASTEELELSSSDLSNPYGVSPIPDGMVSEGAKEVVSSQQNVEKAAPPKTPCLSDITCITRTVDGEEELILGAAPMFQKGYQGETILVSAFVTSDEVDSSKFRNYACIEPVGHPVAHPMAQPVAQHVGQPVATKKTTDFTNDTSTDVTNNEPLQDQEVNVVKINEPAKHSENVVAPAKAPLTRSGSEADEFEGVYDASFRMTDWLYMGSNKEVLLASGNLENGSTDANLCSHLDRLKDKPSDLQSASSMDSLSTTISEKDFQEQFRCLATKRVVRSNLSLDYRKLTAITRERKITIPIKEGIPYGFRLRYSKPAIVTEVGQGGLADVAGMRVRDVILEVNGTDVRNAPHATVVKLAKEKGMTELCLLVGTNICNTPNSNTHKPLKTGYMHKLGGQGMMKNWKKRWFVLKHDGCLYYYKSQDEADPLGAVVLNNYTLVKARDIGKTNAFKLTKVKARTYFFHFETEEEMNSWAKAITDAASSKSDKDVWLDISTHNVGLPALSIKDPDCRGYLTKQGNTHKTWKRRFCVLKDACLYYYKDIQAMQALGIVHFHGYNIQETELAGKKYGFILKPPIPSLRTFYFIADNETERKRWVAALATSIGRWIQTNEEEEFTDDHQLNQNQEMLI